MESVPDLGYATEAWPLKDGKALCYERILILPSLFPAGHKQEGNVLQYRRQGEESPEGCGGRRLELRGIIHGPAAGVGLFFPLPRINPLVSSSAPQQRVDRIYSVLT